MDKTVTLWAIVWISFATVSVGTKDSSIMMLPGLGMLVWWFEKIL